MRRARSSLRRLATAAALAFVAGACAPSKVPAADDDGKQLLAVRIVDDLAGAGAIEHVAIAIDGAPLPTTAVPVEASSRQVATVVRIAPGDHRIEATASVRLTASSEVAVVATDQALHSDPRSRSKDAALAIRVRERSGALALDLESINVALGPGLAHGDDVASADPGARCGGTTPLRLALCRATASYDEASRARDASRMMCIGDKLGRLRDLADLAAAARPRSEDVAADAELEAMRVAREIDGCAPSAIDAPD